MANSQSIGASKSGGRTRCCNQLVRILETPALEAQHEAAASLLDIFAIRDARESLVTIMLDRTGDCWSRIFCLRALVRRNIPVSSAVLTRLFDEFAEEAEPGCRLADKFTDLPNIGALLALAEKSGQMAAAAEHIRRCDGDVLRWILKHGQLSAAHRDVVYGCVLESGALDLDLAYSTLVYRESRAMIFNSAEPIDPQQLGFALHQIDDDLLRNWLEERPTLATILLPELALSLPLLMEIHSEEALRQAALAHLDFGAENQRKAISVLARLADGHLLLDRLIDESDDEVVRIASAKARLRMYPAPQYSRLPIAALMGPLRYVKVADHGMLLWLLESDVPVEQWYGFQGLAYLGLDYIEERFRRSFRDSTEPLFRIAALGVDAALGDVKAARTLRDYVHDAPHVELRAEALRCYAQAHPVPQDLLQVCATAMRDDQERLEYRLPVVEEALRGLRQQEGLCEEEALALLIEARLHVTIADIDWFVRASIRSWLEADHTHTTYPLGWGCEYLYERMDRDEWIISRIPSWKDWSS